MRNFLVSLILIVTILMMSGCSKWFSIGEELTYCEEHGCDYSDVGLCENPIDILKHKNELNILRNKAKGRE